MNDLPLTSARVIQLGEVLLRTLQKIEAAGESSIIAPFRLTNRENAWHDLRAHRGSQEFATSPKVDETTVNGISREK